MKIYKTSGCARPAGSEVLKAYVLCMSHSRLGCPLLDGLGPAGARFFKIVSEFLKIPTSIFAQLCADQWRLC